VNAENQKGTWVRTMRGLRFCPEGKTIKGSVPIDAQGDWVRTMRGLRFCPEGKTIKGSVPIDAQGDWVKGSRGGYWFMPKGWKPKVHLDSDGAPVCRVSGAAPKITSDPEGVTCGSCRNHMLIRRFRVLMILVAVLVWVRTHPEVNHADL